MGDRRGALAALILGRTATAAADAILAELAVTPRGPECVDKHDSDGHGTVRCRLPRDQYGGYLSDGAGERHTWAGADLIALHQGCTEDEPKAESLTEAAEDPGAAGFRRSLSTDEHAVGAGAPCTRRCAARQHGEA